MLVPLIVSQTAVTPVPFAAISGSSQSPWFVAGLRSTESPDMALAVSLWLPIPRLLYPLWLTYSSCAGSISS
jgi:hypothetical protein